MNKRVKTGVGVLVALALLAGLAACGPRIDSSSIKTPGAATSIQNKGSDTLVNVALAWAEAYGQIHPEVQIAVTGGGSGTGIAALINGTVDMANASRRIKNEEREQAQATRRCAERPQVPFQGHLLQQHIAS